MWKDDINWINIKFQQRYIREYMSIWIIYIYIPSYTVFIYFCTYMYIRIWIIYKYLHMWYDIFIDFYMYMDYIDIFIYLMLYSWIYVYGLHSLVLEGMLTKQNKTKQNKRTWSQWIRSFICIYPLVLKGQVTKRYKSMF